MHHIKRKLAGITLAVGLLAIPLGAGAESSDTRTEPTADYGMLQMTELEEIAGRQHLGYDTIKFLEDNLWDYGQLAAYAGFADDGIVRDQTLCKGEGLVDAGNRASLDAYVDSIGRYCGEAYPAGGPESPGTITPWLDELEPMDGRDFTDTATGVSDVGPNDFSAAPPD